VKGRVSRLGTVNEVRRWDIDQQRYLLEFEDDDRLPPGGWTVLEDERERGARKITLALPAGEQLDTALRAFLDCGFRLRSSDRLDPDLEEAFARILGQGGEQP
jgi:hypothetical protein